VSSTRRAGVASDHMAGHGATIRVAIAGGHPAVRGAVRLACVAAPDLDVVGEADEASDAAVLCERELPDVLVLDVDGSGDGGSTLRALRRVAPSAPVALLVLTDRVDGDQVLEVLRLGVDGYLHKADGLRTIADAIRRTAAGERVVDPRLEQAAVVALGRFARQAREGSRVEASLTPREQQILTLISQGFTMHQVGNRLGISARTVETHVAKLYRKLGVRTRVQAVSKAAQLGLLDLDA
jgi:DNA-binding NarL/FixJ family response regulator